jgi:hypothetical protein
LHDHARLIHAKLTQALESTSGAAVSPMPVQAPPPPCYACSASIADFGSDATILSNARAGRL